MDANIESFENACENGDLETVDKLFNVVNANDDFDMLKMRNIAVKKGYLNILKFLHKKGVDINELYDDINPLIIAASRGWVDTESRPRWRGLDDAKFNHARVIKFSVIIYCSSRK